MTEIPNEEFCPKTEDHIHCEHWWDGECCCACGAPAMTDEQKLDQGMEVESGE